ncbi:flagellar biosynthesis protein FlhF [Tautonia sociabilis]|uniref:Flagellar biosynthesis protein FlhF n=1 Tax=Tautonia sociabilis TaxID=2080755 RepID=A0A432MDM4_9BACT|nr:flagellar GTP-binding protein [Tautonia sociabilis]RUL82940.1 flagellar GTP-binding protein [Tautonia sociabilis]
MPPTSTRTYRAGTLKEALCRVRRDLGGSAVILGTRELRRRRWLGLGERELIEVTAAPPGLPADRSGIAVSVSASATTGRAPVPARAGLDDRLGRVREAVEGLSRLGSFEHLLIDVPTPLTPAYARLLDREVPEHLARRLVRLVADTVEPDELHRPEAVAEAMRRAVAAGLPVAPPISGVVGSRRVVALVGPTGVGKTTTVAKIAANAKLGLGLKVGLVTVDTYRIAAIEQLRTYAEIIDLPLAVADAPDRMPGALDDLGGVDLALIDTAGRSPRDEVKIRELAGFLAVARPDEVHLVLSAASGEASLRAVVDRFEPLGFNRLILTKLDEADTLGPLLGVIARAGRPITYLTTGQGVPDDIEPADRDRLAALILGQEALS